MRGGVSTGEAESLCRDLTRMIWNEEGPVCSPQASAALSVTARDHGLRSGFLASPGGSTLISGTHFASEEMEDLRVSVTCPSRAGAAFEPRGLPPELLPDPLQVLRLSWLRKVLLCSPEGN